MNYKEIIKLIKKARKIQIEYNSLENQIFKIFNDNDIDLKLYHGGCNTDNLEEMICCYIIYGDDSLEEIEKRIKDLDNFIK